MSAVLILSTTPTHAEAATIAEALLVEKLAACVQLSPIDSWYRWDGKVEQAQETRLQIKTSAALAERVQERIRALHSYDVPELVMIPIAGGSPDYLAWIEASTSG